MPGNTLVMSSSLDDLEDLSAALKPNVQFDRLPTKWQSGGSSESTIIIGPSKSVLVYALHSLA